ncbi:type I pullulanase [Peribacillus deserti]|uniref:Type I pullulanase n=1 Tax=Peribacillus deserti TaxID=673318 RepID=A0A2N5M4E0_9BACI|nr:type I pullulanase [Peribacillus deserti]PLT29229.1 type I pullulanase [Peribacillus deserti]
MEDLSRPFLAYLDTLDIITILLPYTCNNGEADSFFIKSKDLLSELTIKESIPLPEYKKYICETTEAIRFEQSYVIKDGNGIQTDLQIGAVIRTKEFDDLFYYSGDLGISYSREKTLFKLWAPTASEVKVKLSLPAGGLLAVHTCSRGENGVWSAEVEGNLEGLHYIYQLCVNKNWTEAADPYAESVSLNGKSGVIIDLAKTKMDYPILPEFSSPTDAIIYEAHIRDFSIHPESGITLKGKYGGFVEEGTKSSDGSSTGLDYLQALGITHVELQPVNDFEGVNETDPLKEYNWGYNPLHFNAPEGSYSVHPENPYSRILELKNLIASLQRRNIRVILDVVYNHVYERESSQFEKIVPGYYFRHDQFGIPSNGTGVGNDFASERRMARKYILDSVKYWLSEYHVNGFRFDLMGILDIDTMNEVRKTADAADRSCIILGEGWDLNTPLPQEQKAILKNAHKLPRIAHFNDWFRDTIKGSTFNLFDRGFILGSTQKMDAVKQVITGSISLQPQVPGLFQQPYQTINYIESHDNHTLWDKLSLCSPDDTEEVRKSRHRLGTSIVLLSQGIPFLHSGQEFYRTKQNIENSYNSPDQINWLDWGRKSLYNSNVEYVQGLIKIRKEHAAFRFNEAELIKRHLKLVYHDEHTAAYLLKGVAQYGPWVNIAIIFYNGSSEKEIVLDTGISGGWKQLCDGSKAGLECIRSTEHSSFKVAGLSANVWVQEENPSSS